MSAMNAWTDARIDDFMQRYREDRQRDREWQERVEEKLDELGKQRRWTPLAIAAVVGPLAAAMVSAVALVITTGA